MYLQQAVIERRNSLNVVRLMLATFVIVFHAWPLSGLGQAPAWVLPFGGLAVPGFFCLSGFLIAGSRMRLPLGRFLWNRALRIFPAFWVVLVVVAFVAAPLSTLGGGSWHPSDALRHVGQNMFLRIREYTIPGTLDGSAWNGSLWTLFYEFCAYLGAAALLTLGVFRARARLVVPAVYVIGAASVWWAFGPGEVTTNLYLHMATLGTYFLAGMVLYFHADKIPVTAPLAGLALVVIALAWTWDVMDIAGGLPLAYLLLWLGAVVPLRWAQRHDVSYGVYIYAFPVQVLLEWFAPETPVLLNIVLTILIVTPLAWASWLLMERPAMRLKRLGKDHHPSEPPGAPLQATG